MRQKVFVVEGKSDLEKLREIDPNLIVITTSGLGFDKSLILKLKKLEENFDIVLLLDPDHPGQVIRETISNELKNPIHIFVPKAKSISKNKKEVGVEHIGTPDLRAILEKEIKFNKKGIGTLTLYDLHNLGLANEKNSKQLRTKVTNYLGLPEANSKQLLKYLNNLNINIDKIKEILDES